MIKLADIKKRFGDKVVLDNINVEIEKNEFVSIVGKSGSGKTTLLNIMGYLDSPDSGTVTIFNDNNKNMRKLEKLRRYHFGYIFQNYVLMDSKTVMENLHLATAYRKNVSQNDLIDALKCVQLDEGYLKRKIYQLSGGEQQRIAIARIILKPCDIVLADEPTGNLDDQNKSIIVDIFKKLQKSGKTIVCVTHDKEISNKSDRSITL